MDQGSSAEVQQPQKESDYDRRKREREERLKQPRKTKEEITKEKVERLRLAREKLREKIRQKEIVEEKVRANMPITEDERQLLEWSPGKAPAKSRAEQEALTIAKAAKLVLQPKHVTELRMLVEKTAEKFSYNPIEELILCAQTTEDEELKVGIHKALLPFLVPQLQVPKPKPETGDEGGVKVTITQFVFKDDDKKPLHQQSPTMVTIEADVTAPAEPDQK